jgi:hypothetical protein
MTVRIDLALLIEYVPSPLCSYPGFRLLVCTALTSSQHIDLQRLAGLLIQHIERRQVAEPKLRKHAGRPW